MTGAVVGLLLGAGLAFVWWSCWPRATRVRRPHGLVLRLQDDLVQAGLSATGPVTVVAFSVVSGLAVFVALAVVSGTPAVAACFAVMAAWLPFALVRGRAARRRSDLRALWPDVVDNVASAVRAGLSLPEALAQVGDRGPEPLRPAFRRFARDYRVSGRFGDSLDALKAGLADPVADRLVEALRITRDVGGSDLGRLLRTLSAFLREDLRTRGELQARQSWTVGAARLAVAAPWLVLALLATRPAALDAYDRPAGAVVLAIGAGASLVAYRLMMRIGRLPEDQRVLR